MTSEQSAHERSGGSHVGAAMWVPRGSFQAQASEQPQHAGQEKRCSANGESEEKVVEMAVRAEGWTGVAE